MCNILRLTIKVDIITVLLDGWCLTPPLFIEAHVPSQKNERSYLCALMASIVLVSPIFLLDFGTVPTVWYFFRFSFY